jgi:uncharacterized damage-inducible protein DinB
MRLGEKLKELYEYNKNMNTEFIKKIKNEKYKNPKIDKLMSHILAAHHIWTHRILKKDDKTSVWEKYAQDYMQVVNISNHDLTLEILESFDLKYEVKYESSEGISYSNTVSDILLHVLNHSTHHRAQISTYLREANIDPVPSDYIFSKRVRKN